MNRILLVNHAVRLACMIVRLASQTQPLCVMCVSCVYHVCTPSMLADPSCTVRAKVVASYSNLAEGFRFCSKVC